MPLHNRNSAPPAARPRGAKASRGGSKGLSLHLGLNHVDPSQYQDENGDPWDGELAGCINDARSMQEIAVENGYRTTLFIDEQATSDELIRTLGQFATELVSGDTLLLTYSGHGGQVPDVNGDDEDAMDETWCLFDRMVIDDELYNLWSQFEAGVRIFVLSDSCHSGTMLKQVIYANLPPMTPLIRELRAGITPSTMRGLAPGSTSAALRAVESRTVKLFRESKPPRYHNLPLGVQYRTYRNNKAMYDRVQWAAGRGERATIGASVVLISGCQDNQLSADGDVNGLFTQTLLEVWGDGGFEGDYPAFAEAIRDRMPGTQTPNYYKVGADDPAFEGQKPFTIGAAEPVPVPDGAPSIVAEQDSVARDADAPRFEVTTGANPYYIVEVASDYDLFVNRPDGNTDRFYATYYDQDSPDRETTTTYTLPDHAWEALREADRLYYRIGTTSSESGWDDYTVSTDDGVEPPSIEITAAEAGEVPEEEEAVEAPSITAESDVVPRDGDAPRFEVTTGTNPYYIVEIASDYDLFVNRPDGNTDQFYATYYDQDSPDRETGSTYTLPDHAWEALREADRLYYRIGTTSSESGWDDYTVSTDDGVEPPSIEITAAEERVPPTKRAGKVVGKSHRAARAVPSAKHRAPKPPQGARSQPPRSGEPSPWIGGSRSPEEAMRAARKVYAKRKGVKA